jgi:alcohol dehydrogenase (cytochrome c)
MGLGANRAILLLALLLIFSPVILQPYNLYGQTNLNWTSPAYDQFNSNSDPQTLITQSNVPNLQLSWVYQVPLNPFQIAGAAPALGIETTPLVSGGIAYVATPYNKIIALNLDNGHVVWSYQVNMSGFTHDPWWAYAYTISSLSIYNGTVYMMASDTSVYGFDATTGAVTFYLPPVAANISGNTGQYYGEKAPIIYKNEIIVRASTTDYGGRGFVSAYDLSTRKLLWTWYSVPPSGGDPNWDFSTCRAPCHGNVQPYRGDWGNTSLIGGGAAWGLIALDSQHGVLYFSTGHPSGVYDASLRPGPNLYSDSVIALNATNGQMIWYYQINSHDIVEHEGGWSVLLANLTVNGQTREVVIQPAKNNYIYVLDAITGQLVYPPIHVGPASINAVNDNHVSDANLTASQAPLVGKEICPGPDGGIEMAPAYSNNVLYVVTQNACGTMLKGPVTYKGHTILGYVYTGEATSAQNSTVYAINLQTGQPIWEFNLPYRYQAASAVISGGTVYVVDRGGDLYALNAQSGAVLKSINLGGLGAAGVSIATGLNDQPALIVPVGGGDLPQATAGIVLSFVLPPASGNNNGQSSNYLLYIVAPIVAVVLISAYVIMLRRQKPNRA